ncbi:unnamed protein product [Phaeothamnion confervicola]
MIYSLGVVLLEEFDAVPLFPSAPNQGPPPPIDGELRRGIKTRAVGKLGDWCRIEAEPNVSGWVDASCIAPHALPAFYEGSADLPFGTTLRVREQPHTDADTMGTVAAHSLIYAVERRGHWIRVCCSDADVSDDSGGQRLDGWMLTATADRTLLVPCIPWLAAFGEDLPERAVLNVRAAPVDDAAVVDQLTVEHSRLLPALEATNADAAADGGGWMRICHPHHPFAWLKMHASGYTLVAPVVARPHRINPELLSGGVTATLNVRSAPAAGASAVGAVGLDDVVDVVDGRNGWHRVLFRACEEAWVLAASGGVPLLVPCDEKHGGGPVFGDGGGSGGTGAGGTHAGGAGARVDGVYSRAMGPLKLREEPDTSSIEAGTVAAGDAVRVLQSDGAWRLVAYGGREDFWVLSRNSRGPIGTEAYVSRQLNLRLCDGEAGKLLDRLVLLDDIQGAFALLRLSGAPRPIYNARAVPPSAAVP